jgi:hypothetical protein
LGGRLHARLLAARRLFWYRFASRAVVLVLAVLIACGGWAAWRRPVLDPTQLAHQTYEQSGTSRTNDDARATATAWLRQFDDRLQAPDEFNYRLLSFVQRSDLQGLAEVPTLVFARNEATLRLYAVHERSFKDLSGFREAVEDGGCTVEARRYASMPGWVFITVTSGASPDDFRRPNRPLDPA